MSFSSPWARGYRAQFVTGLGGSRGIAEHEFREIKTAKRRKRASGGKHTEEGVAPASRKRGSCFSTSLFTGADGVFELIIIIIRFLCACALPTVCHFFSRGKLAARNWNGSPPVVEHSKNKMRKVVVAAVITITALIAWNLFGSSVRFIYLDSSSSSIFSISDDEDNPAQNVIDIAKQTNYFMFHDPAKRYFFYQPSGGFGNQRFILRWAMVAAAALNRTLVVAPFAPHSNYWYGYNQWNKTDLVPANMVLDDSALQDAMRASGGVQYIDDTPQRVIARILEETPLTVLKQVRDRKRDSRYSESYIHKHFISYNESIVFWDETTMWGCCPTDDKRDLIWFGKHIVFNREMKQFAWSLLLPTKQQEYNAVHIRRGDMTSRDRATAQLYYKNYHLDRFNRALPLYIASNEPNREWFKYIEHKFPRVIFLSELLQQGPLHRFLTTAFPKKMYFDVAGYVEILICSKAKQFQYSSRSTFSAAIYSARGNTAALELDFEFPSKPSSIS